MRRRTSRSYKSLMANMSIAESQRGIAEAESVTKLTELAFFFIPLTFSASLFSMQIKEISAATLSVTAFLAVAIVITACSYALRLFIRSESFTEFRRYCASEIRADADISPGGYIPTSSFLMWLWHRSGLLATIITILVAILVVPLLLLWTRNMNRGYKAIITLIYVVFVLGTSYMVIKATTYLDRRGRIHVRRDIFAIESKVATRGRPRVESPGNPFAQPALSWLSTRWFLLCLIATIMFIGPMVALWTRPLVTGVKVGVTCAIGLIYVSGIVSIVQNAVTTAQHKRQVTEEHG